MSSPAKSVRLGLVCVALAALLGMVPAPAAGDAPDIHFDRTAVPLDAGMLAERMEKFADGLRKES